MIDSIECPADMEEEQTGDKIEICCTNDVVMKRQEGSFSKVVTAICRLFIGEGEMNLREQLTVS
jgi:hypothetical protein